jgi:hypothetical protein
VLSGGFNFINKFKEHYLTVYQNVLAKIRGTPSKELSEMLKSVFEKTNLTGRTYECLKSMAVEKD